MGEPRYAPNAGAAAVKRAMDFVGKPYPVGWCQKFTNEIFQTGPVGDWDGDNAADAEDGWKKASKDGQVVPADKIKFMTDIPAGVMLYWLGGSADHGHAAVSVGDGMMVSTDLPNSGLIGKVPITLAHDRWGLTFAGFVIQEGNGYFLIDPDEPLANHFRVEAGPNRGSTYRSPKTVSVKWVNRRRSDKKFSRHVWFVQHWLNMAGYKYGVSTGFWDDHTQELYNQFRRDAGYHGVEATGPVGANSLTLLRSKAKALKKVSE